MSDLARRALAEGVGTAFLVAAVVGSGIAASQLSPDDVGLQLLENAIATGGVLLALIVALQQVSASFNPAVTLVDVAQGNVSLRAASALIPAQIGGGVLGAIIANLMFELPAVTWSSTHRASSGHLIGEVVATIGLILLIAGCVHAGRDRFVAPVVAGYIVGAYWFTSSTSFANPAVAIARMFSDTFAGIAPASVIPFIVAQFVGAAIAFALIRALFPTRTPTESETR